MSNDAHDSTGRFAEQSFAAVYAEIKRLDQLRQADKEAVAAALVAADAKAAASVQSSKEAVLKAETAQGNVNATQNEFRGSLKDQASTLMPRAESENTVRELRGLITGQAVEIGTLRSRLDLGPPSLSVLQQRSDEESGRKKGSDATLATIIAAASASAVIGGAIVGIIINLAK